MQPSKGLHNQVVKIVVPYCTYPSTTLKMLFSLNMKMSIISLYLVSSAGGWNENISRSAKGGRERGGASTRDEIQSQKFILRDRESP